MPARRNYSPAEEAVHRILAGYGRRRQLLTSLEKEESCLARRLCELQNTPARPATGVPALSSGWWSVRRHSSLHQEIDALTREQAVYDEMLSCLEPLEREIVRLRHEEGRTWVSLGQRVFLCERQAQRIYRAAVRKMSKLGTERNLFTNR